MTSTLMDQGKQHRGSDWMGPRRILHDRGCRVGSAWLADRVVIHRFVGLCLVVVCVGTLCSCGTVVSRSATEQLLLSNAIDRSIASIDFHPLANKTVYLDTQYIKNIKSAGFVNAEYVISSLRQHMMASRCLLQENQADAEYIVEARVGALGTDDHEVIYGLPANNALGSATAFVTNLPTLPSVPEISVAKKKDQSAAVKIGLFAYHRDSKQPFWQSGVSQTKSSAKDVWIFGAGPFQRGTIYDRTQFAGSDLDVTPFEEGGDEVPRSVMAAYAKTRRFEELQPDPVDGEAGDVQLANHEEAAGAEDATPADNPAPAASE